MMSAMSDRRWARRGELPDHYPIPKGTWDRWASRGEGPPYVRVGRHALYDLRAVDAWLHEHVVEPRRA
jgi:hypothetical protein